MFWAAWEDSRSTDLMQMGMSVYSAHGQLSKILHLAGARLQGGHIMDIYIYVLAFKSTI